MFAAATFSPLAVDTHATAKVSQLVVEQFLSRCCSSLLHFPWESCPMFSYQCTLCHKHCRTCFMTCPGISAVWWQSQPKAAAGNHGYTALQLSKPNPPSPLLQQNTIDFHEPHIFQKARMPTQPCYKGCCSSSHINVPLNLPPPSHMSSNTPSNSLWNTCFIPLHTPYMDFTCFFLPEFCIFIWVKTFYFLLSPLPCRKPLDCREISLL